jgi:hypothetical protein
LAPNEWQLVSIRLEDLGVVDTRLKDMQLQGVVGTSYLDDMALVIPAYRLGEVQVVPALMMADRVIPWT